MTNLTTSRDDRGARAPINGQRCTAPPFVVFVGMGSAATPPAAALNARAAAAPPSEYLFHKINFMFSIT